MIISTSLAAVNVSIYSLFVNYERSRFASVLEAFLTAINFPAIQYC